MTNDLALQRPKVSPARFNEPETLLALIETIFVAGALRPLGRRWEHSTGLPAPVPVVLNEDKYPCPAPEFVE